jgi:hypothetical protein
MEKESESLGLLEADVKLQARIYKYKYKSHNVKENCFTDLDVTCKTRVLDSA